MMKEIIVPHHCYGVDNAIKLRVKTKESGL